MKISCLVFDLSRNSIVRTYPIAKVLERRHEVEIIGPCFGDGIFPPYRDEFTFRTVAGSRYPRFLGALPELLRHIEGDIVFAFKPRPTSFGIALLSRLRHHRPLILDIEDWEVADLWSSPRPSQRLRQLLRLWDPNGLPYTWLMERSTGLADEITVVSRFLQDKFGGTILYHGTDTGAFDPARFDRAALREKWGISPDETIVLFTGTLNPHKGVAHLADAVADLPASARVRLLLVGQEGTAGYLSRVKQIGGDRVMHVGFQPHNTMPAFLALADLVAIPQHRTRFSQAQVPGKVFEAMAMGKAIVASRVSDLPEILGEQAGMIVEPGNVAALREAIHTLARHPALATELGRRARARCLARYSWDAMESTLNRLLRRWE